MSDKNVFDEYEPENPFDKLLKKSKDNPLVPLGLAGFVGVLGLGAYNYKNRGTMATSMYLMQLRVAAQGTVVGTLSVGLIYQIYKRIENLRHPEIVEASATKKGAALIMYTAVVVLDPIVPPHY